MADGTSQNVRFYVEFKWPSIDEFEFERYTDEELLEPLPWTPELRTLLQVNQKYQAWLKAPDRAAESGGAEVPEELISSLNSIIQIDALLHNLDEFCELYPGVDLDIYTSHETSVSRVEFPLREDDAIDLDEIGANQAGITPNDIFKLIPKCKWLSGVLELPLTMTPEQIAHEESTEGEGWYYIQRDVHFRIAGVLMSVYMGEGSSSFSREKERST